MGRRPNQATTYLITDDLPGDYSDHLKEQDSPWLVPGLLEGLLAHVPQNKRGALRKNVLSFLHSILFIKAKLDNIGFLFGTRDELETYVEKSIAGLRVGKLGKRSLHSALALTTHARVVTDYLEHAPYPFKRRDLTAAQLLWRGEHLPKILRRLHNKHPCKSNCPKRTTFKETAASNWAKATPTTLPRMIIGYYHGLSLAAITKSLYSDPHRKSFDEGIKKLRRKLSRPSTHGPSGSLLSQIGYS